jgi:hypothetical protein
MTYFVVLPFSVATGTSGKSFSPWLRESVTT